LLQELFPAPTVRAHQREIKKEVNPQPSAVAAQP
jgi:hypothetical protein